jgi:simple sugar transport system permease protein
MNLFNIGVDGQYRMAALFAAYLGAAVALPKVLHVGLIIVVAMVVGAAWSLVAALLKVYRGVSEVISTIMLNYIAIGIIAYLLTPGRMAVQVKGSNNVETKRIPESGRVGGFDLIPDSRVQVYGLLWLAVAVGIGFWFVIDRTRFGFDLRSTGMSEPAAVASGVNVRRMVISSMLLSGAVAGLIGLPGLLGGSSNNYSLDFPSGLGFTGIAIALIGRNHPAGIAFGALLWSFLDQSSQILDLQGIAKEIVLITQGVAVLSVVVAYELVRRYRVAAQQRAVGRQLGAPPPPSAGGPGRSAEEVPA